MINLQKWRSVISLVACSATFILSIIVICSSLIYAVREGRETSVFFEHFTTVSNIITATASSFIIPFAVNGVRKKRFVLPKWLSVLFFTGAVGTTITMVFSLLVILPYDAETAFHRGNLFFHVICPLTVLVSFMLVESSYRFKAKDALIGLIPFVTYSIVYLVMVVFVGEENGGWDDLYKLNTFIPFYVSLPLLMAVGAGVSFGIRALFNVISSRRRKRTFERWDTDLEPTEVGIELFGLGRYNGLHGDESSLEIPYDIIEFLAERYSMNIMKLVNAYTKGLIDGMNDKIAASFARSLKDAEKKH